MRDMDPKPYVYAGLSTDDAQAHDCAPRSGDDARWVRVPADGRHAGAIVVSVRPLSGRELARSGTGENASERIDAVYDAIAVGCKIVDDPHNRLRSLDDLAFPAAASLWLLCACLSRGTSYADAVKPKVPADADAPTEAD